MNFLLTIPKLFAHFVAKTFSFAKSGAKEIITNKRPDETDPKTNYETTQKNQQEKEKMDIMKKLQKNRANKNKTLECNR